VIRLSNLTPVDLHVLLENVRRVFAAGNTGIPEAPDLAITAFMEHCSRQIGDAYFRTPRNSVKAFVQLLSILEQNPGVGWSSLLGQVAIATDEAAGSDAVAPGGDDELSGFKL